ncbi:hypothetical protein Ava_D0030 [Trichormus variabilis ATCC 29413]|uniref:Uncharacterized protein n=2 Tax=Anabaena variabilis TaxID=264691 RepID=Q3M2U1_TRIV2|nr:hypothetical protein [Trichormus variabilis]ABA24695.1 hypothetical protein Ava_D0030 [Trichormus variabilis ATCC 29413]MBC1217733.1 hypothetical protein [Trichormus variabilis ARAD]MBC1258976.1 hypothetical protein [Trichormus variabilis V5]MBC1302687.1 hypothetical protein [Trichormus variabilis N2B]MBC1324542.1 hypothetical protein [Trichormus variabilis 9RC]
MQPHPEVDQTNMIGWQPVFATNRPPATTSANQNLMPMLGIGAAALFVAASGGVLFKQHQEMNSQKSIWQQEAITQERSRIMECVQSPPR